MLDDHPGERARRYRRAVQEERVAKDAFFRSSPHSPRDPSTRASFRGLSYFAAHASYGLEGLHLLETYGAGRYLDLEPEPDRTYVLDFSAAYHPYCAYSPDYDCPLTPPENRLSVRIKGGERLLDGASPH